MKLKNSSIWVVKQSRSSLGQMEDLQLLRNQEEFIGLMRIVPVKRILKKKYLKMYRMYLLKINIESSLNIWDGKTPMITVAQLTVLSCQLQVTKSQLSSKKRFMRLDLKLDLSLA